MNPLQHTERPMTAEQAAWVAGIIEGEGSIIWASRAARIQVTMTDRDVLERLESWTRMGKIYDKTPNKNQGKVPHKQQWSWIVLRQGEFLALARAIEPYLLARRSAKLAEVREALLEWKARVDAKPNRMGPVR